MNQYANDFNETVRRYYSDLKPYKPITKAMEKRLFKKYRKGDEAARNQILESNLKFVFDIARKYTGRGVAISDLISEGNMGLLKAMEKFDETKGVKFISYAVWWIRQFMQEAIKRNKLVELCEIEMSVNNDDAIGKMNPAYDDDRTNSKDKTNYEPSDEDEVVEKEINDTYKEVVNNIMDSLSERERDVIESYYGINDNKELTLFKIGEKYDLSSERVRQIKKTAIRKMRTNVLMMDGLEHFPVK